VNTRLIPFLLLQQLHQLYNSQLLHPFKGSIPVICIAAKIESVAATTPGPEAYPVNTLLITAELSNVTAPETFPVPSKAPVVT
jgi:hypothetical protein